MSELGKLYCETDAAWDTYCRHPTETTWALYSEAKLAEKKRENPTKCQSTTHKRAACYGPLWQCEKCQRMVCCADGTDTGDKAQDGLCDACWYEKYGEVKL